eukprot:15366058-Ditylum_brightwellii.AAC.1
MPNKQGLNTVTWDAQFQSCTMTAGLRSTSHAGPADAAREKEGTEPTFIELNSTLEGHTIATLICGGIFKDKNQDKVLIIPWSGTDPDSKINCYSWSKDESK